MSRLWHFCSYSQAAFDAYMGGGCARAIEEVIAAVTWDEEAWGDPAEVRRLAQRSARGGISYADLSSREAGSLDELIPALFAPEGLAERWEVVPESSDGLHPSVIKELLLRAAGATLLPALLAGRRCGASEPSACGYCFLRPAECERLAEETERALGSGGPWGEAWFPGVVGECLVGPLRSASSKGRPVFGSLG